LAGNGRPVRRWKRRAWLGGVGVGLAGVGAGMLYRVSPFFWRQFARELGRPVEPPPARPDPRRWPDRGVHVAWLGHSTALMKIDGFTVLTDPVFSTRIGLSFGPLTLGLKRLVEPALELAELPRIDLILLSHAHMDHLDIPSMRALENRSRPVVTARGTADLLRVKRYREVREIGWEEHTRVGPLSIRGLEVRHWGARMRSDTWRGYNAYLLEMGRWRVLFGGDTAITHTFTRVGGADLALMPIGAYNPWIRVHCSPEQAWRMSNDAQADRIIPLHCETFHLSNEPRHEPVERLLEAARGDTDRVVVTRIGEETHIT
jgi:L-ascorbate metabolism protein UlaG (beta-lactamase superfamily)